MAHIAGMLAEELGADVQVAKAGAFVHDIGKALDHEVQGTHIDIGIASCKNLALTLASSPR
jgi:ribonuclease Y